MAGIDGRLVVLLLVLAPLAAWLGFWQLDRAAERDAAEVRYLDRLAMAPLACAVALRQPDVEFVRVDLRGQYERDREYLIDNHVRDGWPGYHVLTPFRCDDGTRVVVDRGFLAAGSDRGVLPHWETPVGQVALTGFVDVADPGLRVAADSGGAWPRIVAHVDAATLGRELGVAPHVVVLDAGGPGALTFDFTLSAMSPARHRAYAVQWFALAVAIVLYAGYRSWQRQSPTPPG